MFCLGKTGVPKLAQNVLLCAINTLTCQIQHWSVLKWACFAVLQNQLAQPVLISLFNDIHTLQYSPASVWGHSGSSQSLEYTVMEVYFNGNLKVEGVFQNTYSSIDTAVLLK